MDRRIRRVTGTVFLMVLSYAMAKCMVSALLTDLIDAFTLTGTRQGLLNSMTSIGALAALFSMFFLQGRVAKKTMIVLTAAVLSGLLFLIGLNRSFGILLTLLLLQGMAMGYFDAYLTAFTVDLNGENSHRALNLMHVFFGIGGLFSAFLVRKTAELSGWRVSYAAVGISVILTLAVFLFTGRNAEKQTAVREKRELSFGMRDAKEFFTDRTNLLLLSALLLYCAFQNGAFGWLSRYIDTALGRPEYASAGLACYWIGTIVCRLISAKSKADPMKRLLTGMFIAGLSQVLGILGGTVLSVLAGTLILGLAGGLCVPTLTNAVAKHNAGRTSLSSSLCSIMNFLSGIFMPIVMASAAESAGLRNALFLPGAAAVCAGILLGIYVSGGRRRNTSAGNVKPC